MTFSRIIIYVSEKYSPIRAKRVTFIFVLFDIISFIISGGGGSIYASPNQDLYTIAKSILLVGFGVQVISLGVFYFFAIIYQRRVKKAGIIGGNWQKVLWILFSGCTLVLVRSIFRIIEFATDSTGYLLTHESWCKQLV